MAEPSVYVGDDLIALEYVEDSEVLSDSDDVMEELSGVNIDTEIKSEKWVVNRIPGWTGAAARVASSSSSHWNNDVCSS